MSDTEIQNIDPDATWCPWCRGVRRWKGRHAAAKHPEKWEAFKDYFEKKTGTTTTWVKP